MDWFVTLVSVGIGLAMIALWTMLIVRGQVPELQANLPSIRFHIAAEMGTGLALVAGGLALAVDTPWGPGLAAAGLGATVYSTVNSPGYYADRSEWSMVAVFAVLALLALIALVAVVWGLPS